MTMSIVGRLSSSWILPLVLLTVPAVVQAQFNYTTNSGAITITGYTGSDSVVTIPSTINGLAVICVGDGAFQGSAILTSVTLPNGVASIGNDAFYECSGLTNATIPNSVTNIGDSAFSQCGLTSVTIPNQVTSIADSAFEECRSLRTVTIPDSVTVIGTNAFAWCVSLDSVTIPSSVMSIESGAFYASTFLGGDRNASITIPGSVTNIGPGAFAEYEGTLIVDPLNPFYSTIDGVLFNKSHTMLIQCPMSEYGDYAVPSGVTTIGDGAFYFCIGLSTIAIPSSVTSIGTAAFDTCSTLTNITIPDSVTNLGDFAFEYCSGLAKVTIGKGVTSIASLDFYDCPALTAVIVDAGNPFYSSVDGVLFDKSQTTLIEYPEAKAGSYTVPNGVINIGALAFCFCGSLNSVTIPNSVTNIADDAFSYCTGLAGIFFSGNAPNVAPSAFNGDNGATVYYLPGTLGWESTFGGLATAPWVLPSPLILLNGPGFGVQTNGFGFTVSWATNLSIVVEACADLAHPVWAPVRTNALINGSFYFSDPQWTSSARRFYRLSTP